jgi:hypothetical protein
VLTVVWRVVVVVLSGVLEHDTIINATTVSAEPSLSAFFIIQIVCSKPIRHKSLPQMY